MKDAGSAFFIKPVLHGQQFFSLNKQQKPFIVTKGTGAGIFAADYGPFHARERITDALLQSALGNGNSLGNRLIIDGLDISAHLVSRTITQERPLLQVLFHASHYGDHTYERTHRHSDIPYHWYEDTYNNAVNNSQNWCMRIYVKNEGDELSGSCVLGAEDNVCIAGVQIPLSWWSDNANVLNVYYSVFNNTNNNRQCIGFNGNDPDADTDGYSESVIGKRRNVLPITLRRGQSTYQELKEDLHILIYIPQLSFHPGSKLRVPVKIEHGSDLTSFQIRYSNHSLH